MQTLSYLNGAIAKDRSPEKYYPVSNCDICNLCYDIAKPDSVPLMWVVDIVNCRCQSYRPQSLNIRRKLYTKTNKNTMILQILTRILKCLRNKRRQKEYTKMYQFAVFERCRYSEKPLLHKDIERLVFILIELC